MGRLQQLVVLYPQAHATNPPNCRRTLADGADLNQSSQGCWNWWGYGDDRQYLTKKGVQVLAIWKMVQRLEGK